MNWHTTPGASSGIWQTTSTHYPMGHPHAPRFQVGGVVGDIGEPSEPPRDELDPERSPDLIGEVLGWREWNVSPAGDLMAANGHAVWRPGPQRAICGGVSGEWDHPAPQEHCGCGWYGLYNLPAEGAAVRGLFRAWGKLVVHPTGFRAEWAEVVCLVAHAVFKDRVKRAAAYYEVPVFDTIEEALAYAEREHGFLPSKLRPKAPELDPSSMEAHTSALARSMQSWQSAGWQPLSSGSVSISWDELGKPSTPSIKWSLLFNGSAVALNAAAWLFMGHSVWNLIGAAVGLGVLGWLGVRRWVA